MIANPLRLLLALALALCNFVLFLLPGLAVVAIVLSMVKAESVWDGLLGWIVFGSLALMAVYLLWNLLFGGSVRAYTSDCVRVLPGGDKAWLHKVLEPVRERFGVRFDLYVQPTEEINAYAIRSLFQRAVVFTEGMLGNLAHELSEEDLGPAIQAVAAHELSHLKHWDFLPGLIVYANQRAAQNLQYVLHLVFQVFCRVVLVIPIIGGLLGSFFILVFIFVRMLTTIFATLVVNPVYRFVSGFISRSIELRCDRDASKAVGPAPNAKALSTMGSCSYSSIFSTHPDTVTRAAAAYRVRYQGSGRIGGGLLSQGFGVFTVLLLVLLAAASWLYVADAVAFDGLHAGAVAWAGGVVAKVSSPLEPLFRLVLGVLAFFGEKVASLNSRIFGLSELLGGGVLRGVRWLSGWQLGGLDAPLAVVLGAAIWVGGGFGLWKTVDTSALYVRFAFIKDRLNREERTPLDWALYQAVLDDNPKAAYRALRSGACIRSGADGAELIMFALSRGSRRMARIYKWLTRN